MATNYTSEHTGAEIDAAVNKSNNPDTTVTEGSGNLVTSGAVHDALYKPTAEEAAALLKALGINVSAEVLNYLSGLSSNLTELLNKKVDDTDIIDVAHGGTGQKTLTADSFLAGNGTSTVKLLTPAEVLTVIGAAATSHAFSSHYLGDVSNTDFNTVKTSGLYYGYTGMTNAAFQSICVLEVIAYSQDWVVQRQTKINGEPITYERHYHSGSTWTDWLEKPTSKALIMRDSTGSKYNVLYTMLLTQEHLVLGPDESTFYTVLRGGIMDIRSGKEVRLFPYYGESGSTYGHVVIGAQGTERGVEVRPSSDSIGSLGYSGCRWKYMYSVNGVSTSSDERLKENVSDDFTKLTEAFLKLRPVTFEYADIKDGKTRIGFIAQELEKAFREVGLDPDKFALLQKDELDPEGDMAKFIGDTVVYSLNYAEFGPWAMAMLQMLWGDFNTLKAEHEQNKETINQLQKTVEKLVETVGGEAVWQ